MKHKKFIEHVKDYKDLSAREAEDQRHWIDTGRNPSMNRRDIDDELFEEVREANCKHDEFIKVLGGKFDKGQVNISLFTPLVFEYFAINDKALPAYQEIKDKWGYLIDFRLSIFN